MLGQHVENCLASLISRIVSPGVRSPVATRKFCFHKPTLATRFARMQIKFQIDLGDLVTCKKTDIQVWSG